MLEQPQSAGAPEWLLTFSDMTSLLLTFFVVLFAMSQVKQDESMAMLESLRKQFGHDAAIVSPLSGRMPPLNSGMRTLASMGRAQRLNTMNGGSIVRGPVGDYPRVSIIRPSGDSTLGGAVFFPEDFVELGDREKGVLRECAEILRGKPQKIEIRGHTSTRPIQPGSPFRTHWDLAYARSVVVMDCLVSLGIEPNRIRLGVAADNEPVQVGPDPAKWEQNARVEVFLLPELADTLEGTGKHETQKRANRPAD